MYVWRLFVREPGTARTTETTVTWPNLWRKKPQLPAAKSGTAWVSPRQSVVSGDCSIDDTATEYVTSQINCSSPSHKSGMLAMSYRCSSSLSRDGTSKRRSHTPEGKWSLHRRHCMQDDLTKESVNLVVLQRSNRQSVQPRNWRTWGVAATVASAKTAKEQGKRLVWPLPSFPIHHCRTTKYQQANSHAILLTIYTESCST